MQRRLAVVAVERAGKMRTAHIEEDLDGRCSLPGRRLSLNTFGVNEEIQKKSVRGPKLEASKVRVTTAWGTRRHYGDSRADM